MLPRIPFAKDFWAFAKAGKSLGDLHVGYEDAEPHESVRVEVRALDMDPNETFRVTKMRFAKKDGKTDKTTILYNKDVRIEGIPMEAYEYVVNGRSPLEWVLDRYQDKTDKATKIRNDPNTWSEDPRYIVELIQKLVTVSLETVRITNTLPALEELGSAGVGMGG